MSILLERKKKEKSELPLKRVEMQKIEERLLKMRAFRHLRLSKRLPLVGGFQRSRSLSMNREKRVLEKNSPNVFP